MNKVGAHYGFWETEWSGGADHFIKSAKRAAALGFDALELAGFAFYDMGRQEMDQLRAASEEIGIELSYSVSQPLEYDISSSDDSVRKNGIAYVKALLENVGYMGGKLFSGITYGAWHGQIEDTKEAHWDRAVQSVREIVKLAEDYGITYGFEMVNRFENFLINDHREAIRFAQEVGSLNGKVLLDTFHMNIEEDDMARAILETGAWLGHFHVGENNRRPPGMGNAINWDNVFKALHTIGYDGWIVMEPYVMPGGQVGKHLGIIREILPDLNLDSEAKAALGFVRKEMNKFAAAKQDGK